MELKGKKILFIGDSITEPGAGTMYWQMLEQRTGAICCADGRSGSCIARQQRPEEMDFNLNIRKHFISRIDEWDADADVVVVFGGVNDFGHGDAPIGSMNDRTGDTFYGALHELYASLLERYPKGRIVVMTPMHFTGEDSWIRFDGKRRMGLLVDYVRVIRQVAEYYAIPVLDVYANSGIQPNVPAICKRFTIDGLHPNELGHARIADCLERFLKLYI